MSARVSVIVTSAGRTDALGRGLRALADQDVSDLEIIVVNDGGPDVSAALDPSSRGFPDRVITLPAARGRAVARNVGIGVATGRYLAFLEEGAFYLPGHLSRLVGLLQQTGAEVGYDACAVTEEPLDPSYAAAVAAEAPDGRAGLLRGLGAAHEVGFPFDGLMLSVADFIPTSAVVCRNLNLPGHTSLRFDDRLAVLEDWELWLRLYQRYRRRFVHSSDVGVVHHDEPAADGSAPAQDGPCGGGGPLAAYEGAHAWVSARYPAAPGSRVARYRRYLTELFRNVAARSDRGEPLPPHVHDRAIRALYDGFTGRMAEDAVPVLLSSAVAVER